MELLGLKASVDENKNRAEKIFSEKNALEF